MQTLVHFLGFTTLASSMWNAAAYIAFIGIIIGVYREKYRNWLVTIGAAVLVIYAEIFLHNILLATLQVLIFISGLLQLRHVSRRSAMITMVLFTIASYMSLIFKNAITDIWSFIGSLGLLGIAFGLVILPKRYGFLVMAVGGVFLTIYTYTVSAWVFFFLTIFFTVANIQTWYKNK